MFFLVNCGHVVIFSPFVGVGILIWKVDIFINWLNYTINPNL
jgi:hypothetical protein